MRRPLGGGGDGFDSVKDQAAMPLTGSDPKLTLPSRHASGHKERMDIAAFFEGHADALRLHNEVEAVVSEIGLSHVRVSKSQVGFYRDHPFAATWMAGRYVGGAQAPLILTIYLNRRDDSPRWKEVVEPAPGRFTHHLELRGVSDVDEFVRARLEEAWAQAA